jgi:uncharacterized membrane protein HdeD (DUF308 family)
LVRLALLLFGIDFVRRRWLWLALLGSLWFVAGIAIFFDALDGVLYFPLRIFGALLLVEGLVALVGTLGGIDRGRRNWLRFIKGILFIVIALLVIDPYPDGAFMLAMLFGLLFTVSGALRISAAWVVRFRGWRASVAAGVVELLFAVFMFEPWPTHYHGTLPYCIGLGLVISGWSLLRLALRLRVLPPHASVSALTRRGGGSEVQPVIWNTGATQAQRQELIVHVWTPVGSASNAELRPIVDRYIAAVDSKGTISTGHAALEVPPDLYVSHYPAVEIERAPDQFARTLRATEENNVPGKFQPSYAVEAAGWCESTEKVRFDEYNLDRLREYWNAYSADTTYNLTNRNCSSTVVHALEIALEGVIGQRGGNWLAFARVLLSPETWVAAQLYRRADTMAWTPGLVLDYARSLHGIAHPPPVAWHSLASAALRRYRRTRAPTSDYVAPPSRFEKQVD